MLDGIRISTLLLVAFAAGYLTRSAIQENAARSTEAPPPQADAVWHQRCGDVDGVKYLFEDIERVARAPVPSSESLWTPAKTSSQRDEEIVRAALEREAERYWFNSDSDTATEWCFESTLWPCEYDYGRVAKAGMAALTERGPITFDRSWDHWTSSPTVISLTDHLLALSSGWTKEPRPMFAFFLSGIR